MTSQPEKTAPFRFLCFIGNCALNGVRVSVDEHPAGSIRLSAETTYYGAVRQVRKDAQGIKHITTVDPVYMPRARFDELLEQWGDGPYDPETTTLERALKFMGYAGFDEDE